MYLKDYGLNLSLGIWYKFLESNVQSAFTYLELTIETLEQGVKYAQS